MSEVGQYRREPWQVITVWGSHIELVGTRLYALEKAWTEAGIGIDDMDPPLTGIEHAFREAAAAIGAAGERPRGPTDGPDPLRMALMRAAELFKASAPAQQTIPCDERRKSE